VTDVTFTATATAGVAASVELVTPQDLGSLVANSLVAVPPAIRVLDALGNPVSGAEVTFSLQSGAASGSLTGATQTTGANGVATVGSWRVGTAAGTVSSIRATVANLNLGGSEPQFSAVVLAAAAANMAIQAPSVANQAATASNPVAIPPSVRVTDAFGNAVSGVLISFVVTAGNGTVTGGEVLTNASGIATVTSWTMPAGSGSRSLIANVSGTTIPALLFTATVP
jgi:adhesin/invasin